MTSSVGSPNDVYFNINSVGDKEMIKNVIGECFKSENISDENVIPNCIKIISVTFKSVDDLRQLYVKSYAHTSFAPMVIFLAKCDDDSNTMTKDEIHQIDEAGVFPVVYLKLVKDKKDTVG